MNKLQNSSPRKSGTKNPTTVAKELSVDIKKNRNSYISTKKIDSYLSITPSKRNQRKDSNMTVQNTEVENSALNTKTFNGKVALSDN